MPALASERQFLGCQPSLSLKALVQKKPQWLWNLPHRVKVATPKRTSPDYSALLWDFSGTTFFSVLHSFVARSWLIARESRRSASFSAEHLPLPRLSLGHGDIIGDAMRSQAPLNPKDLFDPDSKHRRPFARLDGTIEWPRGWTQKDADVWRKANGK